MTLQSGIDSFRVQEPFLAQFAILSKKLRPVATTLHQHLGTINSALETGIPVLPRTVSLNNETADVFRSLDYLAGQPQTSPAYRGISSATRSTPWLRGRASRHAHRLPSSTPVKPTGSFVPLLRWTRLS